MKRVLYGFIVSHVCMAMNYNQRSDHDQQKLNKIQRYHNSYLMSHMRFDKQNMHTRNHFHKQRDYTPKSRDK